MAADIPGEELAHDATIWKLYLEEAEEYDQELVKTQHASLDMLLLFVCPSRRFHQYIIPNVTIGCIVLRDSHRIPDRV